MRLNSSHSTNNSILGHPANPFMFPQFFKCNGSYSSSVVFTSFTVTSSILLLPLCCLILHAGIQQWHKQRQTSAAKAVSHSDFLTFNIVAMEPIGVLGSVFYCYGNFMRKQGMMKAGVFILFVVCLGRVMFQCLTCVEQYLAVIHPVIYLKMKTEKGIRVRNACIGCIWLLCFLMLLFMMLFSPSLPTTPFFLFFAIGLSIITYCSHSVLFALVRPGPGDARGDRKRVDQAKKKAFLTLAFLTVIIFFKYVGLLVCTGLHASSLLNHDDGCVVLMSGFWFCLPSSLSMPLLFLQRVGKLPCLSARKGNPTLSVAV